MLKSMTAYGRSISENSIGQCTLEINCVNRRHLEVHLVLPKEFMRLEYLLRKRISERISRGNLTVKAGFKFHESAPFSVKPNMPLCRQHFEAWKSIAALIGKDEKEISLSLFQRDALFTLEEDEETLQKVEGLIVAALDKALEAMQAMMANEGKALTADIEARLDLLSRGLKEIEASATKASEKMRERLLAKISELLPLTEENHERVLREVCLFADRVDIAEEITRLKSHFLQFRETLLEPAQSQGKKLEFILQEMHREINTIGSKSQEISISKTVIEFKTEIERIREQLQNVE
ncbi:YicC/YloC family endoribonuclease [Estrella lausannensis]|uniref:YicC family protein n=1 Tax=Estrella lausannensis TaxID=483423 RepID=A0A0H5E820_9BACT|nr:YicC/YloC family endoribonuclease [Estrella lausannensis]CRX39495.1 Conserved hypothetical protein [Estrella lausannensis]